MGKAADVQDPAGLEPERMSAKVSPCVQFSAAQSGSALLAVFHRVPHISDRRTCICLTVASPSMVDVTH